jgi:hypothetical protein
LVQPSKKLRPVLFTCCVPSFCLLFYYLPGLKSFPPDGHHPLLVLSAAGRLAISAADEDGPEVGRAKVRGLSSDRHGVMAVSRIYRACWRWCYARQNQNRFVAPF